MGSAFFPSLVYRTSLPESCRDESAAPPPVVCFWAHHSLALSTLSPSFLLLNHSCSLRPPLSSSTHGFLMKADYLAKRVRCCSSFTFEPLPVLFLSSTVAFQGPLLTFAALSFSQLCVGVGSPERLGGGGSLPPDTVRTSWSGHGTVL